MPYCSKGFPAWHSGMTVKTFSDRRKSRVLDFYYKEGRCLLDILPSFVSGLIHVLLIGTWPDFT